MKMDFLGLRTLTVIADAVRFVEETNNEHIDIDNIDYNDSQVLAAIGTGSIDHVKNVTAALLAPPPAPAEGEGQ